MDAAITVAVFFTTVTAVVAIVTFAVLAAVPVDVITAVVFQGARVGSGRAVPKWSCSSWSGSGMTTR